MSGGEKTTFGQDSVSGAAALGTVGVDVFQKSASGFAALLPAQPVASAPAQSQGSSGAATTPSSAGSSPAGGSKG